MSSVNNLDSRDREYHLNEWKEAGQQNYLEPFLAPLDLRDGHFFVDIGCGSGYANAYVAARREMRANIGFDYDPQTVQLARELNAASPSVLWVCASAEAIPLPDLAADRIVCRGVLPLVRADKVLQETGRILRQGGTAVFVLHPWTYYLRWISLNPRSWKRSIAGLVHFCLGLWWNLTGRQVQIRLRGHRIGQTFQTQFRMRRALRRHGMELASTVRSPEFVAYIRKR
jgi:SAM-dependent methyltransferase